jgi:hypothetical protein
MTSYVFCDNIELIVSMRLSGTEKRKEARAVMKRERELMTCMVLRLKN